MQVLKQFVFSRNIVFYVVIAVAAVAIESIFLILSVFINQGKSGVESLNFYLMAKQMILACIFIPLGLTIITTIRRKYESIIANFTNKIKRDSDYFN